MKMKLKYYLRGLGLGIVVTAVIMSIAASKDRKMTNEEIIAKAKQLGMIESTVLTEGIEREADSDQEADDKQSGNTENESAGSGDIASLSKVSAAELDAHADSEVSGFDAQSDDEVSRADTHSESEESEPDTQENGEVPETDDQINSDMAGTDNQIGDDASGQAIQDDADENEIGSIETTSEFPKVIVISNGESSYTVSKRLAEIGAIESAADFDTYLCEHGYDKKIRAGTYTIPIGATDEQMAKIVTGAKIAD